MSENQAGQSSMPVIFVGHGNPMNAISSNAYTEAWSNMGASIPQPKAIVMMSAHWYVPELAVTAMKEPRTVHDFGGFPEELFAYQYPAPGDPAVAEDVERLLEPTEVRQDLKWGLDHGTWAVLCHLFPKANIPVVQISIDRRQSPSFHFELGKRLSSLRDTGILLMGSGNIVHNLQAYDWQNPSRAPFQWAIRFDDFCREKIRSGRFDSLVDYLSLGEDARNSIPTPDHYLPLLFVLGLYRTGEAISFPVEGFDGGSMSMLSVRMG